MFLFEYKSRCLQAILVVLVASFLLSVNVATAKTGGLKYFRQLDSLRYYTFTKNKPAVAKYIRIIARSEPTHYNDLYLICQSYVLTGDTAKAARALEMAVEMGMPLMFIHEKSASI